MYLENLYLPKPKPYSFVKISGLGRNNLRLELGRADKAGGDTRIRRPAQTRKRKE